MIAFAFGCMFCVATAWDNSASARRLAETEWEDFVGLRIKQEKSFVTLGESGDIKIWRDGKGMMKISATDVDFVAQTLMVNGKPLGGDGAALIDATIDAKFEGMHGNLKCDKGWQGKYCTTDINECLVKNGGCHIKRKCTNFVGKSATCGNCPAGYTNDGDKGCLAIRAVYTRWGSRKCPAGTTKLYEGFMSGASYSHTGSGANYLCMHPTPEFPVGMSTGNQNGALLYGTEYENTGAVDLNHDKDAACVVCQHNTASTTYVQWGRKTCDKGHNTEYYGLIMANKYTGQQKSQYVCVDWERAVHATSSNTNNNGALLYTTEMETSGHSSGDEAQYGHNKELSCAVCSPKTLNSVVYSRWGSRKCPSGTSMLYEGFVASSYYTHTGAGYNYLCMHPSPQFPVGMSTGDQNGALLYGTEYENTGAVDLNHDKDAACAVCERKNAGGVYVQWGRKTCSNGHKTEYYGLIMGDKYTHQKSEYICVDWERAAHKTSSKADHNGALLYTTEMEQGSSDEAQYTHNKELSCAVCIPPAPVYTRWGSRKCPSSATELYEGFMAGASYTHSGSGANYVCMHPKPEFPVGASTGDQNGALLYGTEYENTGAVDKNANHDAACVVCQLNDADTRVPYVQWGRKTCTNGHDTEYYGLIMANSYSGQKKSTFVCVDWERAAHKTSVTTNNNGALLYTTEMEQGSSDKAQYGHDKELSCAVCS